MKNPLKQSAEDPSVVKKSSAELDDPEPEPDPLLGRPKKEDSREPEERKLGKKSGDTDSEEKKENIQKSSREEKSKTTGNKDKEVTKLGVHNVT